MLLCTKDLKQTLKLENKGKLEQFMKHEKNGKKREHFDKMRKGKEATFGYKEGRRKQL